MWTPSPEQIITAEQRSAEALEAAWDALRAKRDALLAESDWTQLPDAPVDAEAWAVYRQALRDLPENTADPAEVVWPINPVE